MLGSCLRIIHVLCHNEALITSLIIQATCSERIGQSPQHVQSLGMRQQMWADRLKGCWTHEQLSTESLFVIFSHSAAKAKG